MNRTERLENLSAYLDGELSDTEARLVGAWCENHPEDIADYEAMAEVVSLVRALPSSDPPAGQREAILRAVAGDCDVTATREQALEWLDDYLEGTLSEPRLAVVEHFVATDAAFAETVELHSAMLHALAGMQERETEPPADLKARIQAGVRRVERNEHAAPVRRPITRRPLRREAKTVLAVAALLVLVVFGVGRSPRTGDSVARAPQPAPPVPQTSSPVPAGESAPAPAPQVAEGTGIPADDASQPVVRDESSQPVTPHAVRTPRTVTRGSTRALADNSLREPRNPARSDERERPAAHGRGTRTPDRTSKDAKTGRKRTPEPKAAPLGGERSSGRLANESGGRSSSDAPELVQRRGSVSVLGSDTNADRGDDGRNGRGAVDPTGRTKAPPF